DTITIRVGGAVTDEIKAQLALGRFDAPVGLAGFGAEAAQLGLGVKDWSLGDVLQGLLQDLERLAHLQDANHVTVVDVTMLSEGHAEVEAVVDSIPIYLADVVTDAGGPEHRAGH